MKTRKKLFGLVAVLALAFGLIAYQVHAATLTSRVIVSVESTLAGTAVSGLSEAPAAKVLKNFSLSLSSGTGASAADKIFSEQRTIAASGTYDLDLQGSLTDGLGAAFTPAKIKCLAVFAAAGNTNDVQVGGDTASVPLFGAVADYISVKPGGVLILCHPGAGFAVTATTGDILQFANSSSGTSVTYDVIVIGTSV
jgi:hypothetical protein